MITYFRGFLACFFLIIFSNVCIGGDGTDGPGYKQAGSNRGIWEIGSVGGDTSVRFGPFDVLPFVRLDYQYIDNVSRVSDRSEAVSTGAVLTDTGITMDSGYRDHSATLSVGLSSGQFFDSPADDYLNVALDFNTDLVATTRNRFTLAGYYGWQTEARGTGLSIGSASTLDERNRSELRGFGGDYQFGAPSARGAIVVGARRDETLYTNNEAVTQGFSFDVDEWHAGFQYRRSAVASYRIRFSDSRTRYLDGDPEARDNDQKSVTFEVEWDPRGRTAFLAAIGYQWRDILPRDERVVSPEWRLVSSWQLYEQTVFDFTLEQTLAEAGVVGNYSLTSNSSISWTQNWLDRLETVIQYSVTDEFSEDFIADSDIDRLAQVVSIEGRYAVRRWLDAGINATHEVQRSDLIGGDFEVNSVSLFIAASL